VGELDELALELVEDRMDRPGAESTRHPLVIGYTLRGELERARTSPELLKSWRESDDPELLAMAMSVQIRLARTQLNQ
jgi:hypothetical protein